MRRPVQVTLLTQPDCHFCEQAKEVLDRIGNDVDLDLTEIDLASPAGRELAAEHGVLFAPGVLLDGEGFGYGRVSERRLRKALQQRRPSRP